MHSITRYLAGLLIIAALLGCRSLASILPIPAPTPIPTAPARKLPVFSGGWIVTLSQSGGIMGMSRTLQVTHAGEMTFTDLPEKKNVQASLSAERVDLLTGLAADTEYQPVVVETGCADCYIFSLEISSGGDIFQVQLNQLDLPNSGLQPLVDFLIEDMNRLGQ